MQFIKGTNIDFCYEDQVETILRDLSFELHRGNKIGFIGKNGSGKTTIYKLILGTVPPTSGTLTVRKELRIGHLPQEIRLLEQVSVMDFLWQAKPHLYTLKKKMAAITDYTASNNLMILAEFDEMGGYQFEVMFEKVLANFDLDAHRLDQPLSCLSGGEKTKVVLCQVILTEPDILLLDEPTNHLDLPTLIWLENYLQSQPIPFIVISHDRKFLDNCVHIIWELDDKKVKLYSGNYSFYKQEKEAEFKRMMLEYEMQQKKLKQLKKAATERRSWACTHQKQTGPEGYAPVYESITNFAKKAMKRAKNVEKRMNLIIEKEEAKKPYIQKERKILFKNADLKNRFVLRVNNLGKAYNQQIVFQNLHLSVENGSRLAVTGKNGSGKSTLLKIITGHIKNYKGNFTWAPQVRIGYYAQEFENLDFSQTILDQVLQGDYENQTRARTILGSLDITQDKVFQKTGTLSIGERSKVSLAKIILSQVNVLILDEPTNHLEITAREVIEDALEGFKGTIIFVSHDRYFGEKLATCSLCLDDLN